MSDRINAAPANLREAAIHHQETSDHLRTLPASHPAIQESLDSLGPIFGELREAGRNLLEQRRRCYEQQADAHAQMAHNLGVSAQLWEQHEAESAQQLRDVLDR